MTPRMSKTEIALLSSFLACSSDYFEFGAGGSTYLAATLVKNSVTALDSSRTWLASVAKACEDAGAAIKPELIHVDIGPIGDWGYPASEDDRAKWPDYHLSCWDNPRALNADLFLIDGRFRVACFMQVALRCKAGSLLLIHDFAQRPDYQVVREVAREIAVSEQLSAFQPAGDFRAQAAKLLEKYKYTTN